MTYDARADLNYPRTFIAPLSPSVRQARSKQVVELEVAHHSRMAVFEREDEQRAIRPPRLRTFEHGDIARAHYIELFFDLVFVVAITQLAHELVVDHSLGGFATFASL
jgi:hypothetical protein